MKKYFAALLLFAILIGSLTACKPQTETDLLDTSLSADEVLKAVKSGNYVVFEGSHCTAGNDIWQEFYKTVSNKKSATVNLAWYYTLDKEHVSEELYEEEKDNYPVIFLGTLRYNGKDFTVTTGKSTEETPETNKTYKYLMHYTGEPSSASATFSHYEYYVLVNDNSVTWEEIEHGMFSSLWGDQIDYYTVYTNHT